LESVIDLVVLDPRLTPNGWEFTGEYGSAEKDPLYGFHFLRDLYFKANPEYDGRYTVPVLWDKKKETIVNNESSEVIRMLYTEFDDLIPEHLREVNKAQSLYPEGHLRKEIDDMNEWVYNLINNGVYKTGFAGTQEAYDANVYPLFQALDRIEEHLGRPEYPGPYLFGEHITEADIRLFPTIIRFDPAYYHIFRCNLKTIRFEYPNIERWLRSLYWDESEVTNGGAFKKTTHFEGVSLEIVSCFHPLFHPLTDP
jgi:putative glutathione S-transferase